MMFPKVTVIHVIQNLFLPEDSSSKYKHQSPKNSIQVRMLAES